MGGFSVMGNGRNMLTEIILRMAFQELSGKTFFAVVMYVTISFRYFVFVSRSKTAAGGASGDMSQM